MVGAIMLAANLTTQLLKPAVAGVHWHGLPGTVLIEHSWPSGHATAVMSLALCSVLVAPARWRPAVAAVMATFAVAVCYSFLELLWHYPSDVLGGFEVASSWALLGVSALWWVEQRWPAPRPVPGAAREARVSVMEALVPVGLLVLGVAVCALVVFVTRPEAVVGYASGHRLFMVGAAAIAVLSLALATGATLLLARRR
jgi:hypothetical protein